MKYFPPYKRVVPTDGIGASWALLAGVLGEFVRMALTPDGLDDDWYLREYPDVAAAIARGEIATALDHFCSYGYFEGRRPRVFDVDEPWYRQRYRDVATDIRRGVMASAVEHYNTLGWQEGRAPCGALIPDVSRWNALLGSLRRGSAG